MTGTDRREFIVNEIKTSEKPVSGKKLAELCDVSRQVIVQDIALMRAENYDILSTNRGYIYRRDAYQSSMPKRVFFVRHSNEQVLEEFLTILELGGKILDVVVEHEIYGQIRVDLLIETDQDAREFHEKIIHSNDKPLMALTGDCHYHTVAAPSEKLLDLIAQELDNKGYRI